MEKICKHLFVCAVIAGQGIPLGGASLRISAAEVITADHVAKLRVISSAKISPDGRSIAYVLRVPRPPFKEPTGPSWGELHVILPNGASRPFVTGEVSVAGVDWTPDGSGISFLAKRGEDAFRSLYVIPIDGGEAQKVLSAADNISAYSWSPDGKRVAYIAKDAAADEDKKLKEKGFNQEIYEEGFLPVRVHIATLGADEKPRALEFEGFPSELHWAPQGTRLALAVAATPLIDDHYMKRKVTVIDADTSEIVARFDNPGKLGKIRWSPDARHLAFQSAEDLNDPHNGRLMVISAEGGDLHQIRLGEKDEGDFDDLAWKDNDTILYLASEGVWTSMGEVRRDGSEQKTLIEPGHIVLSALSLSKNGESAAMLSESSSHPFEVYAMSSGNSMPRRMTNSNPWLADMRFAKQEVVSYRARDGLELEGILIRPLDEEKGKRYPLILSVHGGPEAHISNGWQTHYSRPGQTAAARGFAVFYPNYRGSTGRGVEFSKKGQADYAGGEFDDLVDAVDHFVSTGLVDVKRVGITGGSYGGFASAWGATYYSARFAASVMFVGISNLISKSGTTDIPNEMFLVHSRTSLYDNWQWFLERSPIYHVKKARTPLLILHGKEDPRVHPGQSMELHRHVKQLGQAPVRLAFYPGEGHGNRKSAARLDYNLRMLRWFEHYLKGEGGSPPPRKLDYGQEEEEEEEKKKGSGEA